jgi:hypothetical protein
MRTPGLEIDMGWGNHPTSIAGGVLITVGEARLVMNNALPSLLALPLLFGRAAGEGRVESRAARSSFTVSLRARGRRCYSGRHRP